MPPPRPPLLLLPKSNCRSTAPPTSHHHLSPQRRSSDPKVCEMKAKVSARGGESRLAVKKGKAEKDPNKPKRAPSAFFVFMEGFRKEFKEQNPDNKQVSVVAKAGGEKWKSLTDEEKAPYVAKAEKLKAEYTKKIDAYNNPKAGGPAASGDSDKSKSEINDEEGGSENDE